MQERVDGGTTERPGVERASHAERVAVIRSALGALCAPNGVHELRAPKSRRATISGYYSDLDAFARDAARLDAEAVAPGLYFTLNPVEESLLSRAVNRYRDYADTTTNDAQIVVRRWLLIDLDPQRPSGISSSDEQHRAAQALARAIVAWLTLQGVPPGAIILADSGNGAHVLLRIDLPADDHGLCARLLRALDAVHSTDTVTIDTSTANAARIVRLYGTTARKGDSTVERPHRRSALLEVPEHIAVTPRQVLEAIAALLPEDRSPSGPGTSTRGEHALDVGAWLAKYGIRVKRASAWQNGQRWVLDGCPMSSAHSDGAYVVQLVSGAIAAGCHHASCQWKWSDLRAHYEPRSGGTTSAAPAANDSPTDVLKVTGVSALTPESPPEAIEAALRTLSASLAGKDMLRRRVVQGAAVTALKTAGISAPSKLVEAAMSATQSDGESAKLQGSVLVLEDPVPAEAPVDGASLLGRIADTLGAHVILPTGAADAIALWILHTYALAAAWYSPVLALLSPTKRCGKSTVLDLLAALVRRPLAAAHISPAALFRVIEASQPTLLLDEADAWAQMNEDLRGLLNAGHSRTARVIRTVGENLEPRAFAVFGAKAMGAIGKLPGTIMDRSIVVQMRRRSPGEKLQTLRRDRIVEQLEPLRRQAMRWASDEMEELKGADPTMPSGMGDRAADNWRLLFAIANRAGGEWPDRARRAAAALGAGSNDDTDVGVMLLEDLKTLFGESEALTSEEIAKSLASLEGRPWPEWGRAGKSITTTALAKLLKPYGIAPKQIWTSGENIRGYSRAAFADAWSRYLGTEMAETPRCAAGSESTAESGEEVWQC